MDELPAINWRARLTPSMDRRDQVRLYTDSVSVEATKRQVRLRREELARLRPPKKKAKP